MLRPESPLADRVAPSPNYEARRTGTSPDMVLLHYTGMNEAEAAVQWLANPRSRVSAHYLVEADGAIIQMVPEAKRAWHAGDSFWAGERDINSVSIGIEIHNAGHEAPEGLPPYPRLQMEALAALCRDIAARWSIVPARVLGHSDVSPARKIDPGEHFDWEWLSRQGVCIWVPPAPVLDDVGIAVGAEDDEVFDLKAKLAGVGYGLTSGRRYDSATQAVVAAFQRRFRPARVDGRADSSTRETLDNLISVLKAQSFR